MSGAARSGARSRRRHGAPSPARPHGGGADRQGAERRRGPRPSLPGPARAGEPGQGAGTVGSRRERRGPRTLVSLPLPLCLRGVGSGLGHRPPSRSSRAPPKVKLGQSSQSWCVVSRGAGACPPSGRADTGLAMPVLPVGTAGQTCCGQVRARRPAGSPPLERSRPPAHREGT